MIKKQWPPEDKIYRDECGKQYCTLWQPVGAKDFTRRIQEQVQSYKEASESLLEKRRLRNK